MTPENAASAVVQAAGLTPENAELLGKYAGHFERSPVAGHRPGLGHRRLVSRLRRAARISVSATLSASRV